MELRCRGVGNTLDSGNDAEKGVGDSGNDAEKRAGDSSNDADPVGDIGGGDGREGDLRFLFFWRWYWVGGPSVAGPFTYGLRLKRQ